MSSTSRTRSTRARTAARRAVPEAETASATQTTAPATTSPLVQRDAPGRDAAVNSEGNTSNVLRSFAITLAVVIFITVVVPVLISFVRNF